MNDSKTPKIVVGVGLVAVYAGLAFYFLRDRPVLNVAQDAIAEPAASMADVSVPAPAIAAATTDVAAEAAASPAVVAEEPSVAPEPVTRPAASRVAGRVPAPESRRRGPAIAVEPAPATEPAEVDDANEAAEIAGTGIANTEIANVVDGPASAAVDVPSPVQEANAPAGSDSQITADVRTQIAAVAPTSDIEVSTTGGVVELSGSVPSHEEVNKVLVAARSVPNVRSVDASALMVGN